ncbi:MAG: DUF3570 domain-containing protein [Gammaproteobacteria bacterium]|nr:DUF3570 domain-containing protein [Gammaproteobacteria bacterium]
MQLTRLNRGVQPALAAATASLLANCGAHAEDEAENAFVDSGLLFYQESDRVRAIEPNLNFNYDFGGGELLSLGFVADSVTGATPLGAVAAPVKQTFIRPISVKSNSSTQTVTSASGGATVVTIPPPPGSPAATIVAASTTVGANRLPLDQGFNDTRYAGTLGWVEPITPDLKLSLGGAYSSEQDYRSLSGNLGLAQDFNAHNTTVSLGVNYENDRSSPIGGTPTPFASMSGSWKNGNRSKDEINALVGLTQVMSRRWLTSFNYSYAWSNGYQTDPYKLVSVVDGTTGLPGDYLYENRPDKRRKQSVFWENRIHLPSDVVDVSMRYYWDDWSLRSFTIEGRYRFVFDGYYAEPLVRWYRQEAASFFRYYLVQSQALPQYASADTRLGNFDATTAGVKFGLQLDKSSELNLRVAYYLQQGDNHPAGAVGQLKNQNLFPDLDAVSVVVGYSFAF